MSEINLLKPDQRPKGLGVLSVLTLLFTGFGFLFDALLLFTLTPNEELIRTQKLAVAKQVIELQKENNENFVNPVPYTNLNQPKKLRDVN